MPKGIGYGRDALQGRRKRMNPEEMTKKQRALRGIGAALSTYGKVRMGAPPGEVMAEEAAPFRRKRRRVKKP